MASPDPVHGSQEDVIRSLKQEAAQEHRGHALNGHVVEVATNGVDRVVAEATMHDDEASQDDVDGGGLSKPAAALASPEDPEQEEAPAAHGESEEEEEEEEEEEAPYFAAHHVEEPAADTPPTATPVEEHVPPAATPADEDDDDLQRGVLERTASAPPLEVVVSEGAPRRVVEDDELPAITVPEMRDQWLSKRQSSLEIKREVEAQSRPLISKAAMSTSIDEASVRAAYEDVRSDTTDTDWAVFKFRQQSIECAETGVGFDAFRAHFTDDERAFGFIRIQMGDEMSKRQKFVFLTWLGPCVSVIRRAKMSIDKAMVKSIVKNFAVELQVETQAEINVEHFREQLARAGGANYGTGFRD